MAKKTTKKDTLTANERGRNAILSLIQKSGFKDRQTFCLGYLEKFRGMKDENGNPATISRTNFNTILTGKPVSSEVFIRILTQLDLLPWQDYVQHTGATLVPFSQDIPLHNGYFTGREQELELLHQQFSGTNAQTITNQSDAPAQTVRGMGGVGKTQLAAEYAYKHYSKDYKYVFWVNAGDNDVVLAQNFARLCDQLALGLGDEVKLEDRIQAVKNWLSTHDGWLMIFDNVVSAESLHGYLSNNRRGKTLITTRVKDFAKLGIETTLFLDTLLEHHAVNFLFNRTKYDRTSETEADAIALNKELGGLPLALEQAGAYLDEVKIGFKRYLQLYRERGVQLLGERDPQTGWDQFGDYPPSVLITWNISFLAVAKDNPAATKLLEFSAFLAPEDIPYRIFLDGVLHLGDELKSYLQKKTTDESVIALAKLLAVLNRYSLIKWKEAQESYGIHQLIQVVVRDRIKVETKNEYAFWIETTVEALNASIVDKEADFESWPLHRQLLSHQLKAIELAKENKVESLSVGQILMALGFYKRVVGACQDAEKFMLHSLEVHQKFLGKVHIEIPRILNGLGLVCLDKGDYEKAEKYHQEALNIVSNFFPDEHHFIAVIFNNLGAVKYHQSNYIEAEKYHQQALDIRLKVQPNHPYVASDFSNLADIYVVQGDYSKAENFYQRALTIRLKTLPPNHPYTASTYNNLGSLCVRQENFSRAEGFFQKTLDIRSEVLSDNHPQIASILSNLSLIFMHYEDYDKAEQYQQRALSIYNASLPEKHYLVATSYHCLGDIYHKKGCYDEAKSFYQKALQIRLEVSPNNYSDLAQSYSSLGNIEHFLNKYSEAEEFYQKALKIYLEHRPDKYLDIAEIQHNLGSVLLAQHYWTKAGTFYRQALRIKLEYFPSDHPKIISSYKNLNHIYRTLASFYRFHGEYLESEKNYKDLLDVYLKVLPRYHPNIAFVHNQLGSLFYAQGDYEKAELSYKSELKINLKTLSCDHPNLVINYKNLDNVYINLAYFYKSKGDYIKAEEKYKESLKIRLEYLPGNDLGVAQIYHDLANNCRLQGGHEQAEKYYKESLRVHNKIHPRNHLGIAKNYNNLGCLYESRGEYKDAERCYYDAFEIYLNHLDSADVGVFYAFQSLISFYCNYGDKTELYNFLQENGYLYQNIVESKDPEIVDFIAELQSQDSIQEDLVVVKKFLQEMENLQETGSLEVRKISEAVQQLLREI